MIYGKRADARLLSFYWIIIFVLIAIAVVSATLFYISPFDVRAAEARILSSGLAECISKDGQLRKDNIASLDNKAQNLENVCGLTFKDSHYNENQFYISMKISDKRQVIFDKDGTGNYAAFCSEETGGDVVPVCFRKSFFVLDEEDGSKFVLVEIVVAIGKVNQNVEQN